MAWCCFIGLACAPTKTSVLTVPTERPRVAAVNLMEMCWPADSKPTGRVRLSFQREEGKLRNIVFEALDGATVSTARCARQVAYAYPWNSGEVPERVELTPPAQPPSGWVALAFYRLLLSAGGPDAVASPEAASLVSACLQQSATKMVSKFRVKTHPTRISALRFDGQRWAELSDLGDADRCVVAVLSSARYPQGEWLLDFSRVAGFQPEPRGNVSFYFPKKNASSMPSMTLDAVTLSEAMQSVRTQVGVCWNEAIQRRWGLSGARTVRMWFAGSGEVEHVQFINHLSDATSEASDFLLDDCLARVLLQSRFRVPVASTSEGTYSWVFATR